MPWRRMRRMNDNSDLARIIQEKTDKIEQTDVMTGDRDRKRYLYYQLIRILIN